jgi:hypothetical protein
MGHLENMNNEELEETKPKDSGSEESRKKEVT